MIQIPQSVRPCQIEFGEGVERSKPGALYFTPGSTKKITEGELEWIKKHHKQLAAALVILPFDESKGRLAKQKAAEAPAEQPKRPKDNVSKAKQRAAALLKGEAKKAPAPAKPKAKAEPAPEPTPEPEPEPDSDAEDKKGKKKKWGG